LRRLVLAFPIVAVGALPAAADMLVKLRDGRVITLPFAPDDIDSVTFSRPGEAMARPPAPLTAANPAPTSLAPAGAVPPGPAAPAAQAAPVTPPSPSGGAVLRVGPTRDIRLPSQAAKRVKDGDVVEIDAGNYLGDVAVWSVNDLTLRGVGGRAHLEADGEAAQGKAIWVITGNKVRVENIEFSGAKVRDGNGNGVRAEGRGLTIVNCFFHDNEEAILSADGDGDIVIDNSEFARNGTPSGRTHALYIGNIRALTVRGSYFHHTVIGHHIKSRAKLNNILYNRIMDYADGDASYEIDLSNGGRSYVIGNLLQKGPHADNATIIAYGAEGATLPWQELYVVANTLVMDRQTGTFVHTRSPVAAQIADNIFAGPGTVLRGNGVLINNLLAQTGGQAPPAFTAAGSRGNRVAADARFANARGFDYRPAAGSPAIAAGADPGTGSGIRLAPEFQPAIPLGVETRERGAALDIGAFRYAGDR
jgi:hypothetical protein